MGMFNPSFQELFKIYIELLRKEAGFKDTLLDPKHRDAFEQLLKEGWENCYDAMEGSGIPMMLDNMNLLANVHNNHEIEKLEKRLLEIEKALEEKSAGKGEGASYLHVVSSNTHESKRFGAIKASLAAS